MQPINYMQGYQNPLDVIMGHVDKFQQFTQNRHVLQQQAEANRMKQAENYRTLEAQDALRNLDFNNIESVRQFLARYPEHGEGAKAYLARHDEQEQKAMIADMSTSLNLLKNGRYDLLEQDWQEKANAYANMGNRAKEFEYKRMIFQLKKDPKSLQGAMMMSYSAIVGDKAIDGFDKLQTAMSPKIRTIDAGDRHVVEHVDQMTGDVSYSDAFTKGQTPDNRADNRRAVEVANINANSAKNVAQINAQNDVDVANINQSGQNYRQQIETAYKQQQDMLRSQEVELKEANGLMWLVRKSDGHFKKAIGPDGKQLTSAKPQKLDAKSMSAVHGLEQEVVNIRHSANSINKALNDLQSGKLKLGLMNNAINAGKNAVGSSNQESLAYEHLQTTVKDAVNQILQMAKGTQTEGDAQRAAAVILSKWGTNDTKTVIQALQKLQRISQQTIQLKQRQVQHYYRNSSVQPHSNLE